MKFKDFPNVSADLIEALADAFPNKLPDNPLITIQEVNVSQGQQQIIEYLRAIYEKQNKNILEGK